MSNQNMNVYEGLFLFPHTATANLGGASDHIKGLLDRSGAEIISFRKWEERRLAYEIKGNKRGVYFLVYFRAPGANMQQLERDCNLSEQLLRAMMLRADDVQPEAMQAADGRQELEDEIKLRASEAEEGASAPSKSATATMDPPADGGGPSEGGGSKDD